MSQAKKPTIVIVPGAWHTPAHFDPLTSRLEKAGYTVHVVSLPSIGDNPTTTDFNSDVALIATTIQNAADQGEEVIVVVHSAGGVTGSEAVQNLTKSDRRNSEKEGGVVRMVYLCAFAAPEGIGVFKATNGPDPWISMEGPVCRPGDPMDRFYHDVPREEAEKAMSNLKLHSTGALWSDATYAAWKHIPCRYLVCENDRAIPLVAQEAMIADPEANFTVERCTSGHSPMLAMPDFTAEVVRRAAGEQI